MNFKVKKTGDHHQSLANEKGVAGAIEQAERLFKTVRYCSTNWVALLRCGLQTGPDRANTPYIAPDGSTVSLEGQEKN